jgi:glyceraldehyde 3-phosphate dehydrogenase
MRVGINGLGRVGRAVLRNLWARDTHVCAHVNDLNSDVENLAYLIRHDSTYGRFPGRVTSAPGRVTLEDGARRWELRVTNDPSIQDVAWPGSQTDVVVESSGVDSNARQGREVVGRGAATHVVVTNTYYEADFTLVQGVNEREFDPDKHRVVSSSICDTNAIAPVLKLVGDAFGIEQCFLTTLHPWLAYQNLTDGSVRSQAHPAASFAYYPLGRASVGALIPKPTTAGPVLEFLLPALRNKIVSFSYRVPTATVCSADLSLVTSRPVSAERLGKLFRSCDARIVRCNDDMLISVDYEGEAASAVVDLRWLEVKDERYLKLVLWYDNEWGYANRVIDVVDMIKG